VAGFMSLPVRDEIIIHWLSRVAMTELWRTAWMCVVLRIHLRRSGRLPEEGIALHALGKHPDDWYVPIAAVSRRLEMMPG